MRRLRGLSQEQLAAFVGVSTKTIYNIERDVHVPNVKLLANLAQVLGCKPGRIAQPWWFREWHQLNPRQMTEPPTREEVAEAGNGPWWDDPEDPGAAG
ncbi:helix-turn-helix transcriptional regulator [Paraconexibacter algicola]|nr:helix-turn-helix transcriptional regulator [Paraconexibacter algicola]